MKYTGAKQPGFRKSGKMALATRGKTKLAQAAKAFRYNFNGKIVLDIGSSTGGFTAYALEKGATEVFAVEKGTAQMLPFIKSDPRVILYEKTDIFDISTYAHVFNYSKTPDATINLLSDMDNATKNTIKTPDVILADVSFVSLKKVLLHAKKRIAGKNTEFLVMLKPQFEAKPEQLIKGVVKNEKIRREIIKNFEIFLKKNGFFIKGKHDNELTGKNGNKERFYYLFLTS